MNESATQPADVGIHGVDEYIAVDRLIDGAKVFALMILAWCGYTQADTPH